MPFDKDIGLDEIGRASAAMVKSLASLSDWSELWRAFAGLHARESARILDARAAEDNGSFPDKVPEEVDDPEPNRPEQSAADPVVFQTRLNSALAGASMHFANRLQEILARRIPSIRRSIDGYRMDHDPSPEAYWKSIDEVRLLLRELGEFAVDQGREIQERLVVLESELLPKKCETSRRRHTRTKD
jgi:hypothetical protein